MKHWVDRKGDVRSLPRIRTSRHVIPPSHTPTHTVLLQNRGGELADVDLYYDYPNGRNLNIIKVIRKLYWWSVR